MVMALGNQELEREIKICRCTPTVFMVAAHTRGLALTSKGVIRFNWLTWYIPAGRYLIIRSGRDSEQFLMLPFCFSFDLPQCILLKA